MLFADGSELGADVAPDSVHGVATLALRGSVFVKDLLAKLNISAVTAEKIPLGVGIVLGEGGAELIKREAGLFGGGDDVKGETGVCVSSNQLVKGCLNHFLRFGCFKFG